MRHGWEDCDDGRRSDGLRPPELSWSRDVHAPSPSALLGDQLRDIFLVENGGQLAHLTGKSGGDPKKRYEVR